jgi:hypothetical protein
MTQYYGDVYTAVSAFNLCVPSLRASNVTSLYPIHIFAVTAREGKSEMGMVKRKPTWHLQCSTGSTLKIMHNKGPV